MGYCGIKIEDVGWPRGDDGVQMGIEALYKGRLARARHPDRDDDTGLSQLGTGSTGTRTRGGAHHVVVNVRTGKSRSGGREETCTHVGELE